MALGGIEAGGTKFRCAVADDAGRVLAETRLPTTTPAATLGAAIEFLAAAARSHGPLDAIGVAAFGPVVVDPAASDYGRLLDTPKPGWSGADLVGPLRAAHGCPVALDTDVNAAAAAEADAHGVDALAYVTVGTGVGVGLVLGGRPVHGLLHPELGHLRVRRRADDPSFPGICPFHGDCLEGLACGPAIVARYGAPLDRLAADHPAPDVVAGYLAELAASVALAVSPRRLVFGGGVLQDPRVLPRIRTATAAFLNGYLPPLRSAAQLAEWIVAPRHGTESGLAGAFRLAAAARRRTG
jgi:fructokinase